MYNIIKCPICKHKDELCTLVQYIDERGICEEHYKCYDCNFELNWAYGIISDFKFPDKIRNKLRFIKFLFKKSREGLKIYKKNKK